MRNFSSPHTSHYSYWCDLREARFLPFLPSWQNHVFQRRYRPQEKATLLPEKCLRKRQTGREWQDPATSERGHTGKGISRARYHRKAAARAVLSMSHLTQQSQFAAEGAQGFSRAQTTLQSCHVLSCRGRYFTQVCSAPASVRHSNSQASKFRYKFLQTKFPLQKKVYLRPETPAPLEKPLSCPTHHCSYYKAESSASLHHRPSSDSSCWRFVGEVSRSLCFSAQCVHLQLH